MKLYLHIGYPRTGTTTLQRHFFCKHPQINYLGKNLSRSIYEEDLNFKFKTKINEIIDLLLNLNEDQFNKEFDHILKRIDSLDLSSSKINIISEEFIILNSIYYKKAADKKLETFLTRFENLFNKKNIDVYYFFTIRNHHDIISSLYVATTIGPGSISYTPSDLVESLKKKKFENRRLEILMNGFFYYKLYEHIASVTETDKIKVLLYEDFKVEKNKYMDDLSDFLKIDQNISKKLLIGQEEHSENTIFNEDIYTNNILLVLYYKIKRNLKSPKNLLFQFKNKFFAFFVLFSKIPKYAVVNVNFKINNLSKKEKKKLILNGRTKLLENKNLIKQYYEEDLKLLQKEIKLDLKKNNYFCG